MAADHATTRVLAVSFQRTIEISTLLHVSIVVVWGAAAFDAPRGLLCDRLWRACEDTWRGNIVSYIIKREAAADVTGLVC